MKKELLDLLRVGYWEPKSCPLCGGDVVSYGIRNLKDQPGDRRRKQCQKCQHVFYTVEILESPV